MTLSVIIPCYNHGVYMDEALDSVAACKGVEYEVIIVNDGSTDAFTIKKLEELSGKGYQVISHTNHGLAYTRNAGIRAAKGKYILPLDADNKVKPDYIIKALQVLDKNEADIVYAKPEFFGDVNESRMFACGPFNARELFFSNYIDACAVYRKSVWQSVNGYSEGMPFQGHEDWEFWVHAHTKGFRFYFIDEPLYYYRILKDSMIVQNVAGDKNSANFSFILAKHAGAYAGIVKEDNAAWRIRQYEQAHPLRTGIKYITRYVKSLFS